MLLPGDVKKQNGAAHKMINRTTFKIEMHSIQKWSAMCCLMKRGLHTTQSLPKCQAGRYKVSPKRDRPLTYEMANPPHYIAHRKSWNSWNTSNLVGGLRQPEMATEDMFIRKFMYGTWHGLFASEVIIKRRHNLIVIAGIVQQTFAARKMYFLIGYTEEMLSYVLQCPIKLELQSVYDKKDVVFKYI